MFAPSELRFMRILVAPASPGLLCALAFAATLILPGSARAVDAEAGRRRAGLDPVIATRLQALDPENVGASEVAEVLAKVPAPRIILLQGSFGVVSMDPFAEFLIAMGYPAERIANPRDRRRSTASSMDSRQLAGMLAWYYETEGMRPLLIGHSQGGMLAIRVLYDLAGAFGDAIPVWNPLTDEAEPRTDFVDPRTGELRPVVGLRMPYAAAIATGKLPRLLLGPVVDAAEAAQHSRHGHRIHGLLARVGLHRRRVRARRTVRGDGRGDRAQRHASRHVHAHRPSAGRASRPATRSRARGSMPTRRVPVPLRPAATASTRPTSFTPPTSGTA